MSRTEGQEYGPRREVLHASSSKSPRTEGKARRRTAARAGRKEGRMEGWKEGWLESRRRRRGGNRGRWVCKSRRVGTLSQLFFPKH